MERLCAGVFSLTPLRCERNAPPPHRQLPSLLLRFIDLGLDINSKAIYTIGMLERVRGLKKILNKKTGLAVAAAGIGIATLTSCGSNVENKQMSNIEKMGLKGTHQLVDLREVPGFNMHGSLSGGILVTSGELNGQTISYYEFAWKKTPEDSIIIISQIPVKQAQFSVDKKRDPSSPIELKFNFNVDEIIKDGPYRNEYYNLLSGSNPNDFLPAGRKGVAVEFILSPSQFEALKSSK